MPIKFIICPNCQGKGQLQKKKCPVCSNREVYGWFGGYLLFLDRIFTKEEILVYKIKNFLIILIRILFFVFSFWGIICLIVFAINSPLIDFSPAVFTFLNKIRFLKLNQNDLILIFWFSILIDCYLFYFFENNRQKKIRISPRSSRLATEPENWNLAHHFLKRFKIDVAEAFSKNSVKLIQKSWKTAYKLNHQQIEPIHLFAGALSNQEVLLAISRLGLDFKNLQEKIANILSKISKSNQFKNITYSLETQEILLQAYALAGERRNLAITPLEILQAIIIFENSVKEIFYDLEITENEIKNVAIWIEVYRKLQNKEHHFTSQAKFKPKGPINRSYTAIATPNLDAYSQDITQSARGGYLGVCIDREKETENIFRTLEGGKGAILVGEPGVGKTTIINGLARKMVIEDVPKIFQDKRLVNLNLPDLIAGASQPGEIEKRVQILLSEAIRSDNVILFIKDIHNMIGIKTTEGELDVSEILASFLKRAFLPIIATSNSKEYRRLIEGQALAEVFQKIIIEEPDKNTTIQILETQAAYIEAKERVYFSYRALDQAVDLSRRYLPEQFLPAKAINLLKEVAIRIRNIKGKRNIIQGEDVAQLVSEKTKIPVAKITEKESIKLMNLEDQIHQRLIDQVEAVNMVASSIRRARTELRSEGRPIVNLLFLGPTGVGKTELAKTVAEVYFGDEEKIIRLDMSEYQEKASINRLIGVPGSNQGGYLTEAVRQNPSSMLLLDEVEKAHPDILNVFLQVMDDGRLTDSLGRTIDFTNIILISTSNAGADFIQEEIAKNTPVEKITEVLTREKLKSYFRPEFLNRFDGIIVFKPLGREEIRQITKLMLKKLIKQIEEKGIILEITEQAIDELAEAGYDPAFGARPLRRVIQNRVSDSLAKLLLTGELKRRDKVILESGGNLRVEKAEKI